MNKRWLTLIFFLFCFPLTLVYIFTLAHLHRHQLFALFIGRSSQITYTIRVLDKIMRYESGSEIIGHADHAKRKIM